MGSPNTQKTSEMAFSDRDEVAVQSAAIHFHFLKSESILLKRSSQPKKTNNLMNEYMSSNLKSDIEKSIFLKKTRFCDKKNIKML